MALFMPTPIGSTDGHSHIVEMRAGKMFREGTWVYPDSRKGSLYIYRNSDHLMHFCWMDRTTLSLEDDFIIFPGDCTYTRVRECKTGRVYVLRFENSDVRMFYWLQEPKTDKDDDHCRRINYLLNHPSLHGSNPSPFNITQAQLSRIFGPEVAAQLSAIMANEESTRFARASEDRTQEETHHKHDTTPVSGVDPGTEDTKKNDENKKRSNLKSESSEKKQTKSVTILEDDSDASKEDDTKKKNEKNKGNASVTDDEGKHDESDEDGNKDKE